MLVKMPDCYQKFHCIANQCQHCCCMGWEIDVDDKSYEYYCHVDGELGERLRKYIKRDKKNHFLLQHGKCPFLLSSHLCELYGKLGEQSLCEVCTEYPRFEVDYKENKELVLALSCEEVGRIVFTRANPMQFLTMELEGPHKEGDTSDFKKITGNVSIIQQARDYCIQILQNRNKSIIERITMFLLYSAKVQQIVSENKVCRLEPQELLEAYDTMDCRNNYGLSHSLCQQRMDIFAEMEVMDEEWEQEMNNVMRAFYADAHKEHYHKVSALLHKYMSQRQYEYEHLMVYFSYRYLIQAVYDSDFFLHARFAVLCYLAIIDMDCVRFMMQGYTFSLTDRIDNVRIFCKQVEHSKKSMDYLESKIVSEKVFQLEQLLFQIIE